MFSLENKRFEANIAVHWLICRPFYIAYIPFVDFTLTFSALIFLSHIISPGNFEVLQNIKNDTHTQMSKLSKQNVKTVLAVCRKKHVS